MDAQQKLIFVSTLPTVKTARFWLDRFFGKEEELHYIPTMERVCVCGNESCPEFPARA